MMTHISNTSYSINSTPKTSLNLYGSAQVNIDGCKLFKCTSPGVIVRPISFRNFVESFAAEESKPLVATAVARDLRALALEHGSWVSMPPSERGSVQSRGSHGQGGFHASRTRSRLLALPPKKVYFLTLTHGNCRYGDYKDSNFKMEKCKQLFKSIGCQVLGSQGPARSVYSTHRATALEWYGYCAPGRQWKMIRPDPWHCDLLLPNDDRHSSCNLGPDSDELNPHKLTCGKDLTCNVEHANSFRTLTQIGSLPCCNTSPFCSAPACNKEPVEASTATCTKRKPEDNVAYMKQEDTWPAYHGWGGSFELDTLKLLDVLSCKGADCPEHTFDLALDLGANTGYYTEKLTTRDFAKNYVLVEAHIPDLNGFVTRLSGVA